MKGIMVNLKQMIVLGMLYLITIFVSIAFIFQITMISLDLFGKSELVRNISNQLSWKFDGTFKNSPGNIMYVAEDHIWVESVTNQVKIGKLAGNRNLAFGVKNVLEEALQEKGKELSPESPYKLKVEIIYLDVLTTKKNISVFHNNEEEVVIRLRGTLYKDGKKDKEVIVEESSSEISMSTLIIDEGGKFNQTSLSNALKKGSIKLINKLFE